MVGCSVKYAENGSEKEQSKVNTEHSPKISPNLPPAFTGTFTFCPYDAQYGDGDVTVLAPLYVQFDDRSVNQPVH